MDGAMKSKRLFPSHTVAELQESLENPAINAVRRMDLEMAIAQRDKMSAFYVPVFVVPQVMA
jgi:hypothetical protein